MTPFIAGQPLTAAQLESLRALAEGALPRDGSQKAAFVSIGNGAAAGNYLLDVRQDSDGPTISRVRNATIGASSSCRRDWLGGTVGSNAFMALNDVSGAPNLQIAVGSGVLATYVDTPVLIFRDGTFGNERARFDTAKVTLAGDVGSEALRAVRVASAINRVEVQGAASGAPRISAAGADADIVLDLRGKGTGALTLGTNRANYLTVQPSPTGSPTRLMAQGSDTNIGLALVPQGTGALSAAFPDSGITGGNARGANAVDWQTIRSAATQVASGASSVIVGGQTCMANGTNAISGGEANQASATSSIALGGGGNFASGQYSTVIGGRQATTRGTYGRSAYASGMLVTAGDAQAGEHVLRRTSTSATVAVLTTDAAAVSGSNLVAIPANGTYMVKGLVVARQTGGAAGTAGDSAGWEFAALVKRVGSTVTVVGGGGAALAPTYNDAAAAAWRLAVLGDSTSFGISLQGTGEASKNINWVARVLSVETVG